jgi:hypothetical protein
MGAGGWNKGIKGTGGGMKGKKHSADAIEKIKNRPKETYKKPQAEPIITTDLCNYGCGQIAKYQFSKGKLCCSTSHNSCQGKRHAFSELDHTARTAKSLATRIEKGITKSSRSKAHATMIENGTYEVMRTKMQEHWKNNPHQNNLQCPLIPYKNTDINYQGTFEFKFLEKLEIANGTTWLIHNVQRGPALWYIDPTDNIKRLYISDFIIDNTIYEIKSHWTWNKHGKDLELEEKNKAKLTSCLKEGYNVILILDEEEIDARTLDGKI